MGEKAAGGRPASRRIKAPDPFDQGGRPVPVSSRGPRSRMSPTPLPLRKASCYLCPSTARLPRRAAPCQRANNAKYRRKKGEGRDRASARRFPGPSPRHRAVLGFFSVRASARMGGPGSLPRRGREHKRRKRHLLECCSAVRFIAPPSTGGAAPSAVSRPVLTGLGRRTPLPYLPPTPSASRRPQKRRKLRDISAGGSTTRTTAPSMSSKRCRLLPAPRQRTASLRRPLRGGGKGTRLGKSLAQLPHEAGGGIPPTWDCGDPYPPWLVTNLETQFPVEQREPLVDLRSNAEAQSPGTPHMIAARATAWAHADRERRAREWCPPTISARGCRTARSFFRLGRRASAGSPASLSGLLDGHPHRPWQKILVRGLFSSPARPHEIVRFRNPERANRPQRRQEAARARQSAGGETLGGAPPRCIVRRQNLCETG